MYSPCWTGLPLPGKSLKIEIILLTVPRPTPQQASCKPSPSCGNDMYVVAVEGVVADADSDGDNECNNGEEGGVFWQWLKWAL